MTKLFGCLIIYLALGGYLVGSATVKWEKICDPPQAESRLMYVTTVLLWPALITTAASMDKDTVEVKCLRN